MKAAPMILATCQHSAKKHGKDRKGNQRFRCRICGETWIEQGPKPLGDMRISIRDATLALGMLLEGCSIRSVERLTGLHRDTIDDLVLVAGENCQRLLDAKVRDVKVSDVQCDEIWSFVGCKEKTRALKGHSEEFGDSWTFIAIERNTKLVLAHKVGQRDHATGMAFLNQLNRATVGRFQLSTDGLPLYSANVPHVFGAWVDFCQLVKSYQSSQEVTRYSPAKIIGAERTPRWGDPDLDRCSTSHIERLNLTLRMTSRRHTRLTNAHSKSLKHHVAFQAIFFAFYNFCRKHEALKGSTPAMAAGITAAPWTIRAMLENAAAC